MKRVRFTIDPPVGGPGEETEGNVIELLQSIPYLVTNGVVPPHRILNEVLSKGEEEAGMSGGCRWEPFELTSEEFQELVEEIKAWPDGTGRLLFVEPPDWVENFKDWLVWCAEYRSSIPARENRDLLAELEELDVAMKRAREVGDEELAGELFSKLQHAAREYSLFVMRTRGAPNDEE